jgi:hypothetical protein
MSQQSLSGDDVAAIADRLEALEPSLSEAEQALLVGVLGVARGALEAGEAVSPVIERRPAAADPLSVTAAGAVPPVGDAFRQAFTPGAATQIGGAAAAPEPIRGEITIGINF